MGGGGKVITSRERRLGCGRPREERPEGRQCGKGGKFWASCLGVNPGSTIYSPALWPWAHYLTSLCLSFFTPRGKGIVVLTLQGHCRDEII